jgi:hypothetical protein
VNPGYTAGHFTKCVFTEIERAFFTQHTGHPDDAAFIDP